jgi:hypothetical protein
MIVRSRGARVALLAVVAVVAAVAASAHAQTPPACSAAEHRQFDFWLGEWDVKNAAGKEAGPATASRRSTAAARCSRNGAVPAG